MTQKLVTRISILALVFLLAALPAVANEAPSVADVQTDAAGVYFQPQVAYGQLVLTVSGPRDFQHRATFNAGESPAFALGRGMTDGIYNYELRVIPAIDQETHDMLVAARDAGDEGVAQQLMDAGVIPENTLVQSGAFTVRGGLVVADDRPESFDTKLIPNKATVLATNDGVVRFSLCVGGDCPNSPSFGADTLRLQENNLRIHFDDTSNSGSFPANDWRLIANDSANGGDSYLAIEDSTAGRQVFRVDAGAPANSLRVSSSGNIGVGTASPGSLEIHVVDGDSPTLRLEQDGSSGFTAQTYDIVSNEANFFIRDVTNGSRLFFRSKPGAPENSIYIAADGDVGMGTDNPAASLHVNRSNGSATDLITVENNSAPRILMKNTNAAANTEWRFNAADDQNFRISESNVNAALELILTPTGDMTITGTLVTGGPSCMAGCDRVFAADYELPSIEENATSMWQNSYLPAVGPTPEDGSPFNVTEKMGGILNELEKAHIYIEQLNNRMKEMEKLLAEQAAE